MAASRQEKRLGEDGIPLTRKGKPDRRYKRPPAPRDAPDKRAFVEWTRRKLMDNRPWEYVSEAVTLYDLVATDTGAFLKHFVVIRNSATKEEIIVGPREAVMYAGVELSNKTREELTGETVRNELHQIVDHLGESELREAGRLLRYLYNLGDPVFRSLLEAPLDDEPLTEEEEAAIEEAWQDVAEGDAVTSEELRRHLGL